MKFPKSVVVKGRRRKVISGVRVLLDEDGVYHMTGDVYMFGAIQSMHSNPELCGRLTEIMTGKALLRFQGPKVPRKHYRAVG